MQERKDTAHSETLQPVRHDSTLTTRVTRSRLRLASGIIAVIALGLCSRRFSLFPAILGSYPGDALWALMVFFGWAFLKPCASTLELASLALATSYAVELSQLYQAPWINAIRSTTIGHLVLGSGFLWLDLCAYSIGVGVGIAIDRLKDRRGRQSAQQHT